MTTPNTIKTNARSRRGAKVLKLAADATLAPRRGRVPRVARLLALAHRFEKLIQNGEVRHYADLARLGHVTRARVTQVMNLLGLAPNIQEQVLLLPPVVAGKDPVTERHLRRIGQSADWKAQRKLWAEIH